MSQTLTKMLRNLDAHRRVAKKNSYDSIILRNELKESEIDGVRYRIEQTTETRGETTDVVETRLYKLVDASVTYIETKVRAVTEDGIENLPVIKLRPNNDRAIDPKADQGVA